MNGMSAICDCTGNKDLEPFPPPFTVKAAQSLDSPHAGVEKLTGCIFGQKAETSALAAALPMLAAIWRVFAFFRDVSRFYGKVEGVTRTSRLFVLVMWATAFLRPRAPCTRRQFGRG